MKQVVRVCRCRSRLTGSSAFAQATSRRCGRTGTRRMPRQDRERDAGGHLAADAGTAQLRRAGAAHRAGEHGAAAVGGKRPRRVNMGHRQGRSSRRWPIVRLRNRSQRVQQHDHPGNRAAPFGMGPASPCARGFLSSSRTGRYLRPDGGLPMRLNGFVPPAILRPGRESVPVPVDAHPPELLPIDPSAPR